MTSYGTSKIIGLSGSTSADSHTTALISAIGARLVEQYDAEFDALEIRDFLPSLALARRIEDLHPQARASLESLLSANALVIGIPVYKGSYPGLFKHLIDLLDTTAFWAKPILLAATGGGQKHALVIEHQLRPLFGFFEAHTLPTGIYVPNGTLNEIGGFADQALSDRVEQAIAQFAHWLPARPKLHHALGA